MLDVPEMLFLFLVMIFFMFVILTVLSAIAEWIEKRWIRKMKKDWRQDWWE